MRSKDNGQGHWNENVKIVFHAYPEKYRPIYIKPRPNDPHLILHISSNTIYWQKCVIFIFWYFVCHKPHI